MNVKCINICNEHTKENQEKSPWLTVGKEYIVLSIEIYIGKILYLIIDDSTNRIPGLHNANQFEITSGVIPKNWEIVSGKVELFTIGPKAWQKPGFWEECYDGDLKALEIYKSEARMIIEGSSLD